ncbi:MAG: hypothetical protein LW878_14100 [Proteobacteria bacterium]|jgi:hypothetical protein|nr:hypothetical protein [Pseudomonadota bacterium]
MKNKTVTYPLTLKPLQANEPKPLKSLRPTRSMSGIKSLRPKNLPMVATEVMVKSLN